MTNLEWLHSLSVDEVLSFLGGYTSKCHMCGYKDTCTDDTAKCYHFPIGLNIWLMQEHKHVPEIKPYRYKFVMKYFDDSVLVKYKYYDKKPSPKQIDKDALEWLKMAIGLSEFYWEQDNED